jgi:hypothetical protein
MLCAQAPKARELVLVRGIRLLSNSINPFNKYMEMTKFFALDDIPFQIASILKL